MLDSGELTGAAYTAGKGLFTDIIIPSIKKLQEAVDDIQLELTSYKNADAQVSGYGDLDLDQLKELKKLREEQLAIVEAQIQVRENWLNQITDLFSLNWGKPSLKRPSSTIPSLKSSRVFRIWMIRLKN